MESMMNMNMMPFGGHHTTGSSEFNMMPPTSMHSSFPAWWASWSMPSSMPFEHSSTGFGGESHMRNFPSNWNIPSNMNMMHPSMFHNMPSMFNNMSSMFHNMPSMHHNMPSMHHNMPSNMNMMMPHFPMWSNKNEAELRSVAVRPCNWTEYYSMSHPIKFDNFGNRCFAVGFDMHSYKPEEMKVTIKGGKWIVIEASMEEKVDPKAAEMAKSPEWNNMSWLSNAKGCVKRTYYREVALPEGCKAEDIKCFMTGHGWLCFECPMSTCSTTATTCPSMSSMSSMYPMSHPFMSKMSHMTPRHHSGEITFPVTVIKA
jgi:hypothetical protein